MNHKDAVDALLEFEVMPSSAERRFTARLVRYGERSRHFALQCERSSYGTQSWEVPLPPSLVNGMMAEFSAVRLSPNVDFAIGLDGTLYRLTYANGWNRIVVQWWCEIPKGWEAIRPTCQRLVALAGPQVADIALE